MLLNVIGALYLAATVRTQHSVTIHFVHLQYVHGVPGTAGLQPVLGLSGEAECPQQRPDLCPHAGVINNCSTAAASWIVLWLKNLIKQRRNNTLIFCSK